MGADIFFLKLLEHFAVSLEDLFELSCNLVLLSIEGSE
jgi:hypothetical protein